MEALGSNTRPNLIFITFSKARASASNSLHLRHGSASSFSLSSNQTIGRKRNKHTQPLFVSWRFFCSLTSRPLSPVGQSYTTPTICKPITSHPAHTRAQMEAVILLPELYRDVRRGSCTVFTLTHTQQEVCVCFLLLEVYFRRRMCVKLSESIHTNVGQNPRPTGLKEQSHIYLNRPMGRWCVSVTSPLIGRISAAVTPCV